MQLDGDDLEEIHRLSHESGRNRWASGIRRSLVVGDLLYTMSELGIEATDLETLEDQAWVPFR